VVAPIIPAVRSVKGDDDVVDRAVRANVQRTVAQLKSAQPIVARAVSGGSAKVVGAVYDLQSGFVTFMT
jgi:carbonic anhydrase